MHILVEQVNEMESDMTTLNFVDFTSGQTIAQFCRQNPRNANKGVGGDGGVAEFRRSESWRRSLAHICA